MKSLKLKRFFNFNSTLFYLWSEHNKYHYLLLYS